MLYFAYGSNLLTPRLTARCASARVIGTARLEGYRMAIAKESWRDRSGKATILAGGGTTHGVLFDIATDEIPALDQIEGVGKGYDRLEGALVAMAGDTVTAVTYVATEPRPGLTPYDWYLALILAGAQEHGLPAVATALRTQPYSPDPDRNRPGRLAAVRALADAGHHDWRTLLPG
ncbi:MAG: gamma-glutamylcyclotransferase family protein [Pseudomonadota bacterium]